MFTAEFHVPQKVRTVHDELLHLVITVIVVALAALALLL